MPQILKKIHYIIYKLKKSQQIMKPKLKTFIVN